MVVVEIMIIMMMLRVIPDEYGASMKSNVPIDPNFIMASLRCGMCEFLV